MTHSVDRAARFFSARNLSRVSVVALLALAPMPALAFNGTWLANPGSNDYTTGGNWSSNPQVPNETATFGTSTQTTVTFLDPFTVQSFVFNAGAPAYTFTIGVGRTVSFGNTLGVATGVTNNSSNAATFAVGGGTLNFNNATTAANSIINVASGTVNFSGTSTAGTAAITLTTGNVDFSGNSTGGLAAFTMNGGTSFISSTGPNGDNKLSFGSLAGTGGTMTFTGKELTVGGNNQSTTFAGVLTGVGGSMVKTGTGTFITTGNMTFGAFTIANGTVQLGNDTPIAIVQSIFTINAGATLSVFVSAPNQFLNGSFVTGAGNFTKLGTNTINWGAAALNTGTTTISNGQLSALGANLFAATSAHVIEAAGTLSTGGFNQTIGSLAGAGSVTLGTATLTTGGNNGTTEFSGVISGTGSLVKTGTGTMTLTGANTYTGSTTVNAGTLQVGNGGTTGQVVTNITVAAGANIAYNFSSNVTYSGVVSGAGNGIKNGTGSLTLTGVNTYSGTTTINAGTLIVNGSIANSTVNIVGGILKGSGTVGGISGLSGGTVAPGNSIGTINTGNANFAVGSIYQVEVSSLGTSDLIAATGAATITGGTVAVDTTAGVNLGSNYTIITAAGGVTGAFTNAIVDNAAYRGILSYTATTVLLQLQPNAIPVGLTPNQIAARGAIQAGGFTGNPLFAALVGQSNATAQAAYDLASGEIHATLLSSILEEGQSLRRTLLERSRELPGMESGVNFWAHVNANWGTIDSDGNAAEASRDMYQLSVGLDKDVSPDWRIGIMAGYGQESLDVSARTSSARFNRAHVAGYFAGSFRMLSLRGGVAQMFGTVKTNRAIAFTTINDATASKQSFAATEIFGEVGYPTAIQDFPVEPFAGLAWINATVSGNNETGGTAALKVARGGANAAYSTLGAQTSRTFDTAKGFPLTLSLRAAWQHNFKSTSVSRTLTFANTNQSFVVLGAPIDADRALIDASIGAQVLPQLFLSIGYQGALAAHSNDNAVRVDGSWRF